jgi:hypothetical protein
MQYLNIFLEAIKKFSVLTWNFISMFFGFPYEEQAKKLGDWDIRGADNMKTDRVAYRANKVYKS